MISYVRGELAAVEADKAVVDAGGIGYGIFMSQQSLGLLPPVGSEVKIYTYLNVREDMMQLFGFLTREDLEIFRLVIGVSGIGPKGGLNILSCLSSYDFRFAVMAVDVKAILVAPGIGKKTAEKLILELKDKLKIEDVLEQAAHGAGAYGEAPDASSDSGMEAEAVQGLVALGYGSAESMRAVKKTSAECATVEEILKEALKYLF